jgi:hypothetical protein
MAALLLTSPVGPQARPRRQVEEWGNAQTAFKGLRGRQRGCQQQM